MCNCQIISLGISLFALSQRVLGSNTTCGLDNYPDYAGMCYLLIYQGNATNFLTTRATVSRVYTIKDLVDPSKESVLYIHGFLEDSRVSGLQQVVKAYLGRGDVNVLVLDWGRLAIRLNYFAVAKRIPSIGKVVARGLNEIGDVVDFERLHVIGHSLGAHIAGYIGRNLRSKLGRITGLDAALPLFYPSKCHLTRADAKFVVALHTNAGLFGVSENTGSVDFYANDGTHQPGCPEFVGDACSHQRSVILYAESIKNPKAFPSKKCEESEEVWQKNELEDMVIYFSDFVGTDVRGIYCFTTNLAATFTENCMEQCEDIVIN